jgi:hypothetical protein
MQLCDHSFAIMICGVGDILSMYRQIGADAMTIASIGIESDRSSGTCMKCFPRIFLGGENCAWNLLVWDSVRVAVACANYIIVLIRIYHIYRSYSFLFRIL